MWVAVFVLLCPSHRSRPFLTRSLSLMSCGSEILKRAGPASATLIVCEPVSSDAMDAGSSLPGSWGSPSDAVSTTVPVSGGTDAVLATEASNCAGVRAGSAGAAWATETTDPAITPPVRATAPAGTAHRALRDRFAKRFMKPLQSHAAPVASRARPVCPQRDRFSMVTLRCHTQAVTVLCVPQGSLTSPEPSVPLAARDAPHRTCVEGIRPVFGVLPDKTVFVKPTGPAERGTDPPLRSVAPGQQGRDRDGGEQQGEVGDRQMEQPHRRSPFAAFAPAMAPVPFMP